MKTKRIIVRGDPVIDHILIHESEQILKRAKEYQSLLKREKRNLDRDSISSIKENLKRTESITKDCEADLDQLERIRRNQSTALVGGKRRKSYD